MNEDFLLKFKDKINWHDIINFNGWRVFSKIDSKFKEKLPLDFFKNHKGELPEDAIKEFEKWKKSLLEYREEVLNNTRYGNYWQFRNGYYIEWDIT